MPSEREKYKVTVQINVEAESQRTVVMWCDRSPALTWEAARAVHENMVAAVRLVFRLCRFGDALFSTARNARRDDDKPSSFNPKNPQGLG